MSLETLLLLRQVLHAQQMVVGDPEFKIMALRVLKATEELEDAIKAATERAD